MKKLIDLVRNPSGFDSFDNYFGDLPSNDLIVVVTRSRDSDLIEESNWECALEMLGGENSSVKIHRFGHWACGWWDALCVIQGSEKEEIGREIVESIENYPLLDEEDHSRRESEQADKVWRDDYSPTERVGFLRDNYADFHCFTDLLQCVRGEYAPFCEDGYQSLIY